MDNSDAHACAVTAAEIGKQHGIPHSRMPLNRHQIVKIEK